MKKTKRAKLNYWPELKIEVDKILLQDLLRQKRKNGFSCLSIFNIVWKYSVLLFFARTHVSGHSRATLNEKRTENIAAIKHDN